MTVPDIIDNSAFRGKLDDAGYIIHVASPFSSSVDKQTYLNPAVKGTMAVLEDATVVNKLSKILLSCLPMQRYFLVRSFPGSFDQR